MTFKPKDISCFCTIFNELLEYLALKSDDIWCVILLNYFNSKKWRKLPMHNLKRTTRNRFAVKKFLAREVSLTLPMPSVAI